MFADILQELTGRGMSVLLGLVLGGSITWIIARWKRVQERRSIESGDARDTVVIHLHIVESTESKDASGSTKRVPVSLRIRAVGQSELPRVVPNGHLAAILLKRAFDVSSRQTLISMEARRGLVPAGRR